MPGQVEGTVLYTAASLPKNRVCAEPFDAITPRAHTKPCANQRAAGGRILNEAHQCAGPKFGLGLFDAIGETGTARFPIACRIQPEALGFRLTSEQNACTVFDGVSFERQG